MIPCCSQQHPPAVPIIDDSFPVLNQHSWIFMNLVLPPNTWPSFWAFGMWTLPNKKTICYLPYVPTILHTYLISVWSRVFLEKLTGFAANQEIHRILRNPKIHYRTNKRPPPDLYLANPFSPHNPFPLPQDPS
jgi:hypothetical protein